MTWRERLGNLANILLRPFEVELRSLRWVVPNLWERDKRFVSLAQTVRDHTLLSPERLYVLWQFAHYASALSWEGDFAEVGT